MFNTVVTAAAATRDLFLGAGFAGPRNTMTFDGCSILEQSISKSQPSVGELRIVINREEEIDYPLKDHLEARFAGCRVLLAPSSAQGALASAVIGLDDIDLSRPLLIVAGDSFLSKSMTEMIPPNWEQFGAWTWAFRSKNPRWSFLRTGRLGEVTEVVEKSVAGEWATTGMFLFRSGELFLKSATWVMVNNARTLGKFYVSTALNYLISEGVEVGFTKLSREEYWSFSKPSDFLKQEN